MIKDENIRPLHGYVLLRFPPENTDGILKNGILIPVDLSEKRVWRIATVVALDEKGIPNKRGDGFHPHAVKVGDQVVIDRIFGDRVIEGTIHSEGLRVVSEDQITGIISSEDGSRISENIDLEY